MLICIFLCACNLNSVERNLFGYVFEVFLSNLLTFRSVFVLYSLFKCEKKLIKVTKLQKTRRCL